MSIPFGDSDFDFVTAVCVYHHISPSARPALTLEVCRVLRPGGVFCMIEHNPLNPITRLIVSRTPVDADAILLPAKEGQRLVFERGCVPSSKNIFCKNRISISAVLSR